MELKIITMLIEWGPVGLLAGMLFILIREQSKNHAKQMENFAATAATSLSKVSETILIQSELLDEVKGVVKIARKEAFEHRRKFEEYAISTAKQHAKIETILDVVHNDIRDRGHNR